MSHVPRGSTLLIVTHVNPAIIIPSQQQEMNHAACAHRASSHFKQRILARAVLQDTSNILMTPTTIKSSTQSGVPHVETRWVLLSNVLTFHSCTTLTVTSCQQEWCTSGVCAPNREGEGCYKCYDGFYELNGICEECPGSPAGAVVLGVFLVSLLLYLFYYFLYKRSDRSSTLIVTKARICPCLAKPLIWALAAGGHHLRTNLIHIV